MEKEPLSPVSSQATPEISSPSAAASATSLPEIVALLNKPADYVRNLYLELAAGKPLDVTVSPDQAKFMLEKMAAEKGPLYGEFRLLSEQNRYDFVNKWATKLVGLVPEEILNQEHMFKPDEDAARVSRDKALVEKMDEADRRLSWALSPAIITQYDQLELNSSRAIALDSLVAEYHLTDPNNYTVPEELRAKVQEWISSEAKDSGVDKIETTVLFLASQIRTRRVNSQEEDTAILPKIKELFDLELPERAKRLDVTKLIEALNAFDPDNDDDIPLLEGARYTAPELVKKLDDLFTEVDGFNPLEPGKFAEARETTAEQKLRMLELIQEIDAVTGLDLMQAVEYFPK